MNKVIYDVNTFWFYAVFWHIAGSIVFNMTGVIPYGSIICLAILWSVFFFFSDRSRKVMAGTLLGCFATFTLFMIMSAGYQSVFLMNSLMFLLIYYVCRQRNTKIAAHCGIKKIPAAQWGIIVFLTVLFLVIASYLNAVSMLFVENRTSVSLLGGTKYLWQSIIVNAVFPAFIEEMLFRGCIYGGIKQKKAAVLISALMFALLHMNFNQMSYAFVMGILFALIVSATNNLSVSIAIHLLFNCYNIIAYNFPASAVISKITSLRIGGYHILAPNFIGENGEISAVLILTGFFVMLLALALTAALLYALRKGKRQEEKDGVLEWKQDKTFWAGCIACAAIAVSYEIML